MAEPERLLVLEIDKEVCAGHGRCYGLAPDLFSPDERGYGLSTGERSPESERDELEQIVAACPEEAISITTISVRGAPR